MSVKSIRFTYVITILIACGFVLSSCGGGGGGGSSRTGGGDNTNPTVTATDISDNAIGILETTTFLTADFSEPMDSSTLTPLTFTLNGPAGTLPATVSYSGTTATLTLSSVQLDYSTTYIARISTAAKDIAGNGLATDHEWRFTTRAQPDTTPPQVSSTNPSRSATGVADNSAINAIFSEPLDCATVTVSSFLVDNGVTGSVTCSGNIATFTPDTNALQLGGINYTVTISTDVQDLAGNALAASYNWSFTTGAVPDSSAPQVSSTNPANAASGVTVNSGLNATFNEALDCTTISDSNFTLTGPSGAVSGSVSCNGDTAAFTPASDLEYSEAYTATILNTVTDLAGNAMVANYDWSFSTGAAPDTRAPGVLSTSPANNAPGIDINNQVGVIFSEPMDPASITTASFTLTGPSGNVNGNVTYTGTSATFTPAASFDTSTSYTATVTTAAQDLAGNAIPANYSWSFTTSAAPDMTNPTVVSTVPANGEMVETDALFSAVFSEPLDCATVTTTSFSVDNGVGVSGNVSCNDNTVSFTPDTDLAYSTTYTATLSTAITDLAGNSLSVSYDWSVDTGVAPDTTAPQVSSTSPGISAIGVTINTAISAVFDETIDCTTVDTTSFLVNSGAVSGTVSCNDSTATFVPDSPLANNTLYNVRVTTAVQDLAGNALVGNTPAGNFDWSFTTAAAADTTNPTVVSTAPVGGATGVANDAIITAVFSELLNCTTVTTSSFSLDNGVTGSVDCSNGTATFTPDSVLDYSTTYTATLTTAVQDQAGNALAGHVWSFTIDAAPDLTGPVINSRVPDISATDVAIESIVTVTFDEPLDCSTVNDVSFTLSGSTSGIVTGNVSCSGNTAMFTPASNLEFNENYTATLTTGITDLVGNPIASYNWSFTTLQNAPWIKQFGSGNYDDARAVAVDPTTGDVYLAGTTLAGIDGNSNAGGWDVFVRKYDANGEEVWTEQLGTSTDDNVRDITVDSSGNVYVTGYSAGDIGSGSVSTTIDAFLIKYDSNGILQWTQSVGTSFHDYAHGVAVDALDNVYMAGYTYGDLAGATDNGADLFLFKYDSNGNELWKRQYGNSTDDLFITGMDIDTSDNLYIVGFTYGTVASNPGGGAEDGLLIKYDSSGNWQWTNQFGNNQSNTARAVAVDKTDNTVYVAGTAQDAIGAIDLHLLKYDSSGISQGEAFRGTSGIYERTFGIAADSGSIYLTGYTEDSLDGNPSGGGFDMFLVKFNSALTHTWTRQLGTGANDVGYGVAVDSSGDAYVAGYTLGTLEHNVNSGLADAFVVKYDALGIRQ